MSELAKTAYLSLYPTSKLNYDFQVKYSGKFAPYNANVRYHFWDKKYHFSLSKEWQDVSNEIVVGLLQHLILRIKNKKINTINIELYEDFMRNISDYIVKDNINPYLSSVFDKVNLIYFNAELEKPNLKWGQDSKRTLGHYNFGSDTITISTVFKNLEEHQLPMLELVMYHEMLHKKHKFESNKTTNRYHTTAFRADERKFKDYHQVEKQIENFVRSTKKQKWFNF